MIEKTLEIANEQINESTNFFGGALPPEAPHCGQWFDIIPFLIGVLGGEDWEWRDIWHYITEGWDEFTVFIVLFYIYIFSESPLERMWGELKKNEESQGQHEQHVQKERGIEEPKKVTHRLEEVIENLEVSIEII